MIPFIASFARTESCVRVMDRIYFKINGKKYSAGGEFTVDTTLNEFVRRHAELRGTKYMCQEGGCGACVVHVRVPGAGCGEDNSFSVNSFLVLTQEEGFKRGIEYSMYYDQDEKGKLKCNNINLGADIEIPKEKTHLYTNETTYRTICNRKCLVAIMSCDNWEITTIEGIGNRKDGYSIIQKRLNHFFGSQCGYCSPGFVMSLYSLLHANDGHITEKVIENSFGSNMCRCTGYRPILEAFKSLAVDANPKMLEKIKDIEDIDRYVCPKLGEGCKGSCSSSKDLQEWCLINAPSKEISKENPKQLTLADGKLWFKVNSIEAIFETLEKVGYDSYMLVAGNTAKGVRPIVSYPKNLIDVSNIKFLQSHYVDLNLVLGANMNLTETMSLFKELAKSNDDFWYLQILSEHIDRVAHIPVRNIGTLAGNLVLKNKHPDFQSDIFLLLDCIGATVTLVDKNKQQTELSMTEFLETDVVGKVMTKIKLPPLSKQHKLVTFKITPREQNAHAEVNAGFLLKFDPDTQNVLNARIVYGGIAPSFTHAHKTEKFLVGRNIFDNNVLQGALHFLESEIHAVENPPDPSPAFREKLAISLFYKCVLKLCPQNILSPFYKSGGTTTSQDRPGVSNSYQEFDTDKNDYPLTQPILKREGMIQCAGEAVYTDDMPTMQDEVFASFALCTVTKGEIESIEVSQAMEIDGVIAVLTSADIPGVNSFVKFQGFYNMVENEELLAANQVQYYNQPVAIVVAKTQAIADRASNYVSVNYKQFTKRPLVLTIEDAIKAPKDENRLVTYTGITRADRGANVHKVLKGTFVSPMPYHYMMELHTTIVKPVDESLEVYCSTQWADQIQAGIAQVLNVPESSIIVNTKRCGGAFGCKISRANLAACAAALVSKKLNRPCRLSMRMPDIMRALGKRCNSRLDYEVGVDDNGEIQYMDATFYVNDGSFSNENENSYATDSLKSCYNSNRWKVDSFGTITDIPGNCYMRAPGAYQAIAAIEHIMDHISVELNKDSISVRMANYRKDDNKLPTLLPKFTKRVNYEERQDAIEKHNKHNRWKKRAIKLHNMAFPTDYVGNYSALVAIYHGDGSVIVNIGGVEIGQGIFTRIAQVAARELQVPAERVSVLPCYNFATPNNYATGSSITTECSAYAVIRCCEQINARLAPVRAAMPSASWLEIVQAADTQGINLQANYLTSQNDPRMINYSIFGIAILEVEVDILTGTKWIVRLDILEDAGRSINPELDIGQVEGAIIQSLSSWIMEEIKFNNQTGEIYTDRSWNYKIFGAKDIPHDMRVYLERGTSNPVGILGSKAVGEPPVCLGHVIVESLRAAIQNSRLDSGYDVHRYLPLDVPVSNQSVIDAAEVKIEEYILY